MNVNMYACITEMFKWFAIKGMLIYFLIYFSWFQGGLGNWSGNRNRTHCSYRADPYLLFLWPLFLFFILSEAERTQKERCSVPLSE